MLHMYLDCTVNVDLYSLMASMIDCNIDHQDLLVEAYEEEFTSYLKVEKLMLDKTPATVVTIAKHNVIELSEAYQIVTCLKIPERAKQRCLKVLDYHFKANIKTITVSELSATIKILKMLDYYQVTNIYSSPIKINSLDIQLFSLFKNMALLINTQGQGAVSFSTVSLLKVIINEFTEHCFIRAKYIGVGISGSDQRATVKVIVSEYEQQRDYFQINVIETNIDDMNPQFYEHVCEKIRSLGVHEVYLDSVYMKKGRPGTVLKVICSPQITDSVIKTIYKESSSIGVRIYKAYTTKAKKEMYTLNSPYGNVSVKIAKEGEDIVNIAPEYEDCRKIALETGIPLKDVYREIQTLVTKT